MSGVLFVYGAVLVSYFLIVSLVSNLEFVSFVFGWVLKVLRYCFWVPLDFLVLVFGSPLGFLSLFLGHPLDFLVLVFWVTHQIS